MDFITKDIYIKKSKLIMNKIYNYLSESYHLRDITPDEKQLLNKQNCKQCKGHCTFEKDNKTFEVNQTFDNNKMTCKVIEYDIETFYKKMEKLIYGDDGFTDFIDLYFSKIE